MSQLPSGAERSQQLLRKLIRRVDQERERELRQKKEAQRMKMHEKVIKEMSSHDNRAECYSSQDTDISQPLFKVICRKVEERKAAFIPFAEGKQSWQIRSRKVLSGKIERKGRKMKNLITFFRGIEAKRQISLEEERKVPLVLTIDFNMAKLTPHKTVQFKYELQCQEAVLKDKKRVKRLQIINNTSQKRVELGIDIKQPQPVPTQAKDSLQSLPQDLRKKNEASWQPATLLLLKVVSQEATQTPDVPTIFSQREAPEAKTTPPVVPVTNVTATTQSVPEVVQKPQVTQIAQLHQAPTEPQLAQSQPESTNSGQTLNPFMMKYEQERISPSPMITLSNVIPNFIEKPQPQPQPQYFPIENSPSANQIQPQVLANPFAPAANSSANQIQPQVLANPFAPAANSSYNQFSSVPKINLPNFISPGALTSAAPTFQSSYPPKNTYPFQYGNQPTNVGTGQQAINQNGSVFNTNNTQYNGAYAPMNSFNPNPTQSNSYTYPFYHQQASHVNNPGFNTQQQNAMMPGYGQVNFLASQNPSFAVQCFAKTQQPQQTSIGLFADPTQPSQPNNRNRNKTSRNNSSARINS